MEETKSSYFNLGVAIGNSEHAKSEFMIKALTSPDFDQDVKSYIMYCFDIERKKGNIPKVVYELILTMTGLKSKQLTESQAREMEQNQVFMEKIQNFAKNVIPMSSNV